MSKVNDLNLDENSKSKSNTDLLKKQNTDKLIDLLSVAPLLFEKEVQIISILLANDLVTLNGVLHNDTRDYRFSNISLTESGEEIIDKYELSSEISEDIESLSGGTLTDQDVENYRNLFPHGCKGPGERIVKFRLERFMSEHKCSLNDIMQAAEKYIKHNQLKGYNIMAAHYFLYKRDQQSKIDESKCEEYLELIKANPGKDWREEVV